jgi:hypothetical protein
VILPLLLSLHSMAGPGPVAPPARYKIISKTVVDVGMGGMAPITMTTAGFVSIQLTDSAGGKVVHVVIDSSALDMGELGAMMGDAGGPLTESAKGVTLHGLFRNGKMEALVPSATNAQAGMLMSGINLLLQGMHVAKAGETWVDSIRADTAAAGMAVKSSMITSWTAKAGQAGAMQFDGVVEGTSSLGGGGPMQMEMKTTGNSHIDARTGKLPATANLTTKGSSSMDMGGQALNMVFTMEITATELSGGS